MADYFLKVIGYAHNVLHQSVGIFKNIGVNLLNEIFANAVAVKKLKHKGVIDVTVMQLSASDILTLELKNG